MFIINYNPETRKQIQEPLNVENDVETMVDNSVNTTTAAMVEGGSAMDTGDVYADRMKRMMN